MKKGFIKNKKGFSFIEVMLSVFLLSVGMIAVISLMSSNLRDSMDSRDQSIAGLLAQEGVEMMRNYRDTCSLGDSACLATNPFNSLNLTGTDEYSLDFNGALIVGPDDSGTSLFYQPVSGSSFYVISGDSANKTRFKRWIRLSSNATERVEISVVVTWDGGNPRDQFNLGACNTGNKCVLIENTLIKPAI